MINNTSNIKKSTIPLLCVFLSELNEKDMPIIIYQE